MTPEERELSRRPVLRWFQTEQVLPWQAAEVESRAPDHFRDNERAAVRWRHYRIYPKANTASSNHPREEGLLGVHVEEWGPRHFQRGDVSALHLEEYRIMFGSLRYEFNL